MGEGTILAGRLDRNWMKFKKMLIICLPRAMIFVNNGRILSCTA